MVYDADVPYFEPVTDNEKLAGLLGGTIGLAFGFQAQNDINQPGDQHEANLNFAREELRFLKMDRQEYPWPEHASKLKLQNAADIKSKRDEIKTIKANQPPDVPTWVEVSTVAGPICVLALTSAAIVGAVRHRLYKRRLKKFDSKHDQIAELEDIYENSPDY